jgi:predicted ATPase
MEIVKALFETEVLRLEAGVWAGNFARISEEALPLPATLSEAIQGRVQRLREGAQEVVRLATVLGREFTFELLNEVLGKGEERTLEALEELLRQRILEEAGEGTDSDFAFSHHKLQEVIYSTLPRTRRLHWHARVGAAMERIYGTALEARAGEVAYHFAQACLIEHALCDKAVGYLLRAGQHAVRQSAHREAIAYFRHGLEILDSLPETAQRLQKEIELQIALGTPTSAVYGYASPETKQVYDRARVLCWKLGETPSLFASLAGLSRHYGVSGDLDTGWKLAQQLNTIAEKTQDRTMQLEAYRQLGGVLFAQGRLQEARSFCERGVALYDLAQHEHHSYRFGHDPAVSCLSYLAVILWLMGFARQAQTQSGELSALIQSLSHPSSLAFARWQLALHAYLRCDPQVTGEHAEAGIRLGRLHGLPPWTAFATALRGWSLIEQGETAEGWNTLDDGISAWRATGFEHFSPFLLALKAEVCLKLERLEEGIAAAATALNITGRGGDRFWLAELYRLHGELQKALGKDDRAVEADFRQALDTACQQGATMLQLRAVLSLAQLRLEGGHPHTVRQLVAPVCEQFTDGSETPELQEALNLLSALS